MGGLLWLPCIILLLVGKSQYALYIYNGLDMVMSKLCLVHINLTSVVTHMLPEVSIQKMTRDSSVPDLPLAVVVGAGCSM